MAAHSQTSPVIQPVLSDQPQTGWAPWLRQIAAAINLLGSAVTALAASIIGGQLPATATADDAAAGKVGEVISVNVPFGAPVSLPGGTTNLAAVTLTAGDWDVDGNFYTIPGGGTVLTDLYAGLTTISGGLPADNSYLFRFQGSITNPSIGYPVPMQRFSLAVPTNVFLTLSPAFSVSTLAACGNLRARRAR